MEDVPLSQLTVMVVDPYNATALINHDNVHVVDHATEKICKYGRFLAS